MKRNGHSLYKSKNHAKNINIKSGGKLMEMNTQDYLKKALLDTQERIRDFMHYSEEIEDEDIRKFFSKYAENEAHQAKKLQSYIRSGDA